MNSDVAISGSLRNKLAVTLIGGVTVLTLLLYWVVRDYAANIAQQSQDSILRASVTSMLDTAVIQNGSVVLDLPYSAFSMLSTSTDDRMFYAVWQNGSILSGYENLHASPLDGQTDTLFRSTTFMDVPVRQVTASRVLVGADVRTLIVATIAQTQENMAGTLRRISKDAAMYGTAFFALAVLLSIWVASSTIGPLKKLANSIARRGPEDLSPIAKPVPSEMVPLVFSFNHLMTELENSFSQSEDFIAEAAHRVRTPLSTLRSYAEGTLQRIDDEENRQALRSMIRALDESSRAATQLLDHAMTTFRAKQLEHQNVALNDVVGDVVLSMIPVAEMKDIDLELHSDDCAVISGDAILIQNAVRNIIDNALKYSPPDSTVNLYVYSMPTPYIEVIDHGSGFPADEIGTLTGRFTRGSNTNESIGSGLGLTIARDVAIAHNGKLIISNTSEGGACVRLSF